MKVQGNRYINNPEMIKNKVEKKTTVPIFEKEIPINPPHGSLINLSITLYLLTFCHSTLW